MKGAIKRNGGAVSIQVVFMMLVLVTLGAFAIVSARVNYNFSVKALEWNRMYYALEDKAERFVMAVDGLLKNAGDTANRTGGEYTAEYVKAALDELSALIILYPGAAVQQKDDGLYAEMNFVSDTNAQANLRVVLYIHENPENKRYAVREWAQWQSPAEPAGGIGLWDGFLD